MFTYSPVSVGVRSSNRVPVDCEYEVIQIKWDSGHMDLVPPAILTEAGLTKIRKILRLSAECDLRYQTKTLEQWREALKIETDLQIRVLSVITDQYNAGCEENKMIQDKAQAKKHFDGLRKRKDWALKQLDARRKKMQKCKEILEEYAKKYY